MKNELKYEINSYNLKIIDSYLIKDKVKMEETLKTIFNSYPQFQSERDIKSFIREWKAHNFFYNLHILRYKTKDCDFEAKQKWNYKILYLIFGGF